MGWLLVTHFCFHFSALETSLSLEFRIKVKKPSKTSVFRALSINADETAITWLEIILDYQRSKLEVLYLNNLLIVERTLFELVESHNTWMSFILTLIQDVDSIISLTVMGWPKQERALAGGLSLAMPQNTQFEIGGRSSNANAAFVVSLFP